MTEHRFMGRWVLSESVWLAIICLIDTALTVYLVELGLAKESNPLLAWTFDHGSVVFVATKMLSFVPAIAIIEALRPKLGEFAQVALRLAIIAYIAFYVVGSIAVHV